MDSVFARDVLFLIPKEVMIWCAVMGLFLTLEGCHGRKKDKPDGRSNHYDCR